MSETGEPEAAARAEALPLSLEDVAAAVLSIGSAGGFAERAARLLAIVRTWAEPAAVFGFVRDPAAEGGLRALPELAFGHTTPGQERSLARLVDEAGPERLAAPWLIPPPREVTGYRVKPLDSWLVPWSAPGRGGFVLLRGIAAPYPPNLAHAVALAAQGVWAAEPPVARPAGTAAESGAAGAEEGSGAALDERVQAGLDDIERAALTLRAAVDGLRGDWRRAARPPAAERPETAAALETARQEAAAAQAAARAAENAARESAGALAQAQGELAVAREQRDVLERACAEAELDRDQARREVETWRREAEESRVRLESEPAGTEAARSRERVAELEGEAARSYERVAELEGEAARSRERVTELEEEAARSRERVTELEEEAARSRERVAELESADESARAETTALRERIAELQNASGAGDAELRERLEAATQAQAAAEAARAARHAEAQQAQAQAEEQRQRADALQAQLEELRDLVERLQSQGVRAEADQQALDGARQALKISEGMLARQTSELEGLRRQRVNLQEQLEAAERARAASEAERDRARSEVNPLWATIESLQRQIKDEQNKLGVSEEQRTHACAALDEAQARITELAESLTGSEKRLPEAEERVVRAERAVAAASERWDAAAGSLRAAWVALKRTPFVPPTLRMAISAAQAGLGQDEGAAKAGAKATRVLLLDRDTLSLEPLAAELEAEGLEVLVAHYADEVAFFLKTPEARQLTALLADVMAFRSDADLLERFRVWRLDMPALGLLVSYRAEDPAESERARRLPLALAASHVPRPLQRAAVVEAVAQAARRALRPTEAAAAPPRPGRR